MANPRKIEYFQRNCFSTLDFFRDGTKMHQMVPSFRNFQGEDAPDPCSPRVLGALNTFQESQCKGLYGDIFMVQASVKRLNQRFGS